MLICRPLGTVWAGVVNAQVVNVIAQMQPGDRWIIYHVGDERRVVGIAAVTTAADGDPRDAPAKLKVVVRSAGACSDTPYAVLRACGEGQ